MNDNLALKTWLGIITTPIFFGVPIFLAAGTLDYWEAWVFLSLLTIVTALYALDLLKNDPETLKRRMKVGPAAEERPAQRIIMVLFIFVFSLLPIVSGLDHRNGWSEVPVWLVVVGDVLVALSYFVFCVVLRQNRFAAATIQLAEGQKVISTGLYGIVRHPMYAGALVLMVGIPLALGSYWALCVIPIALPALHWRMVDEEKFLMTELDGYKEYCDKVRFRLIPGVY